MKKEVIELRETIGKFTQGKDKLYLILSSQRYSLNKNGLGFKKDGKPSKGVNHKKTKHQVYKCIHYKRVGHLENFVFIKQRELKGPTLYLLELMHLGLRRCGNQKWNFSVL